MKTFVFVFLLGISLQSFAETYSVDHAKSLIKFQVLKLSRFTVVGRFNQFSGNVEYDSQQKTVTSIQASIVTGSLETENLAFNDHIYRDRHLKSKDFFDVANFGTMDFAMTNVIPVDNRKSVSMEGTLKIKNTTHAVPLEVEYLTDWMDEPTKTHRAKFRAKSRVNRQDFGLSWNKLIEGVNMVGDDVIIDLEIEVFRNL